MSPRPSSLVPRPSRSAFTLVELMVVILIIGILVGILIPVVGSVRRKAQAAATLAQINAIRGAIEAYQGTYNAYPGPGKALISLVWSPFAVEKNAVVLAAADDAGLTAAAEKLLALMQ